MTPPSAGPPPKASPAPALTRPGLVRAEEEGWESPRPGSGGEGPPPAVPLLLITIPGFAPSLPFLWKPSDAESWNLDVFPAFGLLIKTNKSATWSWIEKERGREGGEGERDLA